MKRGRTNWEKLRQMSDEEITRRALADPDAQPLTDEELEQMQLGLYPRPKWAVQQIVRCDRDDLVEDICEHGVGHPNVQWLKDHDPDGTKGLGIHGCDGCCSKIDEV